MIFDELILENFGAYKGRHVITLTPTKDKPIVLFGGLNGGGKTTLMDALQLALYGKLANCSNRFALPYETFLQSSIHRNSAPEEGASLQLRFRHRSEGKESSYCVRRDWSINGKSVREKLEVSKDDSIDRILTESWQEYVEEFFPVKVSNLFFFDGEKIESLANPDNCVQTLKTAIHSLLGLDVVERLGTDLVVLERRKQADVKSAEERKQIDALNKKVSQIKREIDALVQKQGQQRNEILLKEKALTELERRFEKEGGKLYERCKEIETKRDVVADQLFAIHEELRELAGETAPLLLVTDLLHGIRARDLAEQRAKGGDLLISALEDRDDTVLRRVTSEGISTQIVKRLEKILSEDRKSRSAKGGNSNCLDLSENVRQAISTLFNGSGQSTIRKVTRLIAKDDELANALSDLDRKLASIPDAESIAELAPRRDKARVAFEQSQLKLEAQDAEMQRLKREQQSIVSKLESALKVDLDKEDDQRIVSYSQKVRRTLDLFRDALLLKHSDRLETLIFESIKQLFRKQTLISRIEIEPNPLSLKLWGGDGGPIDPDRLSAGERQLLATAILWGLARAVGKPLPTIIDTPLGRLDSFHRSHLVEHYFPHASHQVILLSTDEEISHDYYRKIEPWIGRSYTLAFNEAESSTTISPGYWVESNVN